MDIDDLHIVDRPVAFPVYSVESYGLPFTDNDVPDPGEMQIVPRKYEPGRIVLWGFIDPDTREIDWDIEDRLGPNDIVYCPLYIGEVVGRIAPCDGTHQKLECYDRNLRFMRNIAPKVRAILIGNAGPELSFKHLYHADGDCTRRRIIDEMRRFVDETSEMITGAGGSPAYGPIDWDIALDAYFCDGAYRDHCNGRGIIQLVFGGYQLFGLREGHPTIPNRDNHGFWPLCPRQEGAPWSDLSDYIGGYDHIVSGVGYVAGIQRGNDVALRTHGFDAGLCGDLRSGG